jgi:hypothetical protein
MDKDSLSETDKSAEIIRNNVAVEIPFGESEKPNLYKMEFPREANSLASLSARFEQHRNIIMEKYDHLMGSNCLDNVSINLGIIESFPNIAFNLEFNLYILNKLHGAITAHHEFKPMENRGYYLRAIQESDEIAKACFQIMKTIKSWVHKDLE